MIQVEGVTVAFGRTVALDSVTVEIPGGVTGVFGPNGSGKSTLLRVIAGLITPASGTITMNGNTFDHRNEPLRRKIGYAGHLSGLYARLSVRENLTLFASMYGTPLARVDEMIGALDLGSQSEKAAGELSAGLKRRAAVARALLHEPEILLLDEPYANVDDEAGDRITDAVKSWRAPERIGLIATHGAKRVKPFADAGLILQRGSLSRFGTYTSEGFTAS